MGLFHGGQNSKFDYYLSAYTALSIPRCILRALCRRTLTKARSRKDWSEIERRLNYYNRLSSSQPFDSEAFKEKSVAVRNQKKVHPSVYYLDSYRYARAFDPDSRWILLPGDIVKVPEAPAIVKSRPLDCDNTNSVLLNLNKVRHFVFVNDHKSFAEKKDMVIFRGAICQYLGTSVKKVRYDFVKRYYNHPMCDVGGVDRDLTEYQAPKMTIPQHLDYKFIMSLEGNDVATNLKWVMSSNSIAVMPKPTCETWFMEGSLIPNYHYIEIKPDCSDLIERLEYYIAHPDEAQEIIRHAHEYVDQFRNRSRERVISLMVMDRYFSLQKN